MSFPRDVQRAKLYRAERAVADQRIGDGSVEAAEAFVKKVWPWVKKARLSSMPTPRVKDGRGTRSASGCEMYISIPRWGRTYLVVLHELAHSIRLAHWTACAEQAHGREFAKTLLKLVDRWHPNKEAGRVLRQSFKDNGVKYVVTKEAERRVRYAARERLDD